MHSHVAKVSKQQCCVKIVDWKKQHLHLGNIQPKVLMQQFEPQSMLITSVGLKDDFFGMCRIWCFPSPAIEGSTLTAGSGSRLIEELLDDISVDFSKSAASKSLPSLMSAFTRDCRVSEYRHQHPRDFGHVRAQFT